MKDTADKPRLSNREKEILTYIAKGFSNKEIAEKLFLSIRTVECHKNNISRKLKVRNIAEMVIYAIKNKIISIE